MSRPGVEVTSAAAAPPVGVPTDTSVAFIVGEAQMGSVAAPTRVSSLDNFSAIYGGRLAAVPYGYDAVDCYFHEGGSACYFMRVSDGGTAATVAATAIVAGSTARAANPGVWGNGLTLNVVTSPTFFSVEGQSEGKSGKGKSAEDEPVRSELLDYPEQQSTGFIATVSYAGKAVQTSASLITNADLQAFLASGPWMTLSGGTASAAIAAASVTLAGGTDGTSPASAAALASALALIPKELGPGQVLAPGRSANADQAALLAHAASFNRFAILDCGVADTVASLPTMAGLLRGALQDRYGMLCAPWAVVPGVAPGTLRTVPWSAIQAGLCARNDAAGNPNQAAAGQWGVTQYAVDLPIDFSATDAETLMYAGVNTARSVYGVIQNYGFRTLVDPAGVRSQWLEANWARLNMAIVADCDAVGQGFVFAQIDGRGHTI